MYFNRSFRDGNSFYSQLHRGIGASVLPRTPTYLLANPTIVLHRCRPPKMYKQYSSIHFSDWVCTERPDLRRPRLTRSLGSPTKEAKPLNCPFLPGTRIQTDPLPQPYGFRYNLNEPGWCGLAGCGSPRRGKSTTAWILTRLSKPPIRILAAKVRVCIQDFGLCQNSEV